MSLSKGGESRLPAPFLSFIIFLLLFSIFPCSLLIFAFFLLPSPKWGSFSLLPFKFSLFSLLPPYYSPFSLLPDYPLGRLSNQRYRYLSNTLKVMQIDVASISQWVGNFKVVSTCSQWHRELECIAHFFSQNQSKAYTKLVFLQKDLTVLTRHQYKFCKQSRSDYWNNIIRLIINQRMFKNTQ